jgi:glycosyltransferase involved in cell wall biosynthesis
LRILFLDTKPIRRGAQVFLHDLYTHFNKSGIVIKRIYLYNNDSSISLPLNEADEILYGNEKHLFEKYLTIHPWLLLRLIKSISKFQPDIILLNGSKTLKYGALSKILSAGKYKLVYRVIDSPTFWNTSFFTKFYYKKLIVPIIDAAVGVSHASLKDMKALYHFTKPSTVIHRAVNFKSFSNVYSKEVVQKELGIEPNNQVLIFIGNLTSQKRPDRFIEIVKRVALTNKNVQAIILGDGPLRNDTEKGIVEAGLQSIIKMAGYKEDVGPYIAVSDLLLLTSDTEGLPGIVPEAGFFKVPAIASNVGGIAECIEDGITGFIIEKNEIDLFVEKTLFVLQSDKIRNEMGEKAQTLALKDFDIINIAENYLDFFKMLNNKST